MTADTLITLTGLAFAAAFTPGPNNALVANSGATFGLRRTVPHVLGIAFGFPLMIFIIGLFLGEMFQQSQLLRELLHWAGAALLLYIAWKIATSGGLGAKSNAPRPFTFFEAAGFQWINPKGWAMAIAITAQFITGENMVRSALTVALVFLLAGLFSATSWAAAGQALTRWIDTPERLSIFNGVMGAMIAACVILLFID